MDILSSALVLIACAGISGSAILITRNRTGISKHSRQHIKDVQSDLNYLREQKNNDIKDLRQENLRLKGQINKAKQGTTVTDTDLKNSANLSETLMSKFIPRKYHEVVRPLLPKAEAYLSEHQEEIIEQIKSINNKKTEAGTSQNQDLNTL
jgi:hypothetical protein